MEKPFEKIVKLLEDNNVPFEMLEHEPVYTSEQAAAVRGTQLSQGAKALLLKAKGEFVLTVIPGDRKLDSRKLKKHLGVKDMRFATPDEVIEIMGCEIGACYPFGNVAGLRTIVDVKLSKNEIIVFNAGKHESSIKIKYCDFINLASPEIVDITAD